MEPYGAPRRMAQGPDQMTNPSPTPLDGSASPIRTPQRERGSEESWEVRRWVRPSLLPLQELLTGPRRWFKAMRHYVPGGMMMDDMPRHEDCERGNEMHTGEAAALAQLPLTHTDLTVVWVESPGQGCRVNSEGDVASSCNPL